MPRLATVVIPRYRMGEPLDRLYERILVARCQLGDEAAFAEIVVHYEHRLRYFLKRLLGNVGDGARLDDLLQDVWLEVYRGVRRLRDPAAFGAWLYRIARDQAYGELRRARATVRIELHDEPFAADCELDEKFTVDEAQRVHECLDELSPHHREVLVLRFMEGMSYDDIASVVGSNVGTIRSRLHYAKRALRAVIERRNKQ